MIGSHHTLHKLYHDLRHDDLLRTADQARLAHAVESSSLKIRFYYPPLAALGRWMMVTGKHMQQRYGALRDLPPARSGEHATSMRGL